MAASRSWSVLSERFESAMHQLACSQEQLEGLAVVLAPAQLVGGSPQERAARAELAQDALQLVADAEVAIDSGEPEEVVLALFNAVGGLAFRLRDLILDEVVASSPVPDNPTGTSGFDERAEAAAEHNDVDDVDDVEDNDR